MMYNISDNKFYHYFLTMRPPLLVLSFLASLGLATFVGKQSWELILVISFIVLINTGCNVLNELLDEETDRKIKPKKPIPSGKVNKNIVWGMFVSFISTGLILLYLLGISYDITYLAIGLAAFLGGLCYNMLDRGILGNIYLGATYGLAAYISTYPHLFEFAIVFALWTFSFNIVVEMQDIEGDEGVRKTVPLQIGLKKSSLLSVITAFISVLLISLYLPLVFLPFLLSAILIMTSSLLYLVEEKEVAEYFTQLLLRRGARILLLIGFLILIFA